MPGATRKFHVHVDERYCTGCGNCVQYCPLHVLARDSQLNARGISAPHPQDEARCTGCELCEMFCGNFAIAVGPAPDGEL